VCESKSQGGLGVLDLEVMNTSMLAKWLVRFLDPKVIGLWKIIIWTKYSANNEKKNLTFEKWLMSTKSIVFTSIDRYVGNVVTIQFSHDKWLYPTTLASVYPHLYSLVQFIYYSECSFC
jgi:hypothetical protein